MGSNIYVHKLYEKNHYELVTFLESDCFINVFRAQLFEGRLALNPGLNLTLVSFSCVQKHFLG